MNIPAILGGLVYSVFGLIIGLIIGILIVMVINHWIGFPIGILLGGAFMFYAGYTAVEDKQKKNLS